MKRLIAVMAVALAVAPCYGQSEDAVKRAKVEELMSAMHIDSMMSQMTEMAKAQVQQSTQGMSQLESMTPQQKKLIADFQSKSLDLVMASVSWKVIEPDVVKLYTATFTDDEIDGITAFYKSPSGQALLSKTPQLMTGMMQFTQNRIANMQPKLKALADQFQKDMAATRAEPKS